MIIGIDPGYSGYTSGVSIEGINKFKLHFSFPNDDNLPTIINYFKKINSDSIEHVAIEKLTGFVGKKEKDPGARKFLLGKSYGEILAINYLLFPTKNISLIHPLTWQNKIKKIIGVSSKGLDYSRRKKLYQRIATSLVGKKTTLGQSDSVLIAIAYYFLSGKI